MRNEFTRHNRWQYSTANLLQARIETHQKYSERNDWAAWLAAHLPQPVSGAWLDVGSGDGTMLTELANRVPHQQLFALDQSAGMLAANRQKTIAAGLGNVAYVNGEAEALPFADDSFALVTANHMLYHVPDIAHAVAEMHRVLKPGGTFIATTNVRGNYRELGELRDKGKLALDLNIPSPTDNPAGYGRFSLEDGADYIAPYFPNVTTLRHDDALLFTDVDGVMRYLLSGPLYSGTQGPDDPAVSPQQWQQLADWIALRVERIIIKYGVFRVSKAAGAFVATKLPLLSVWIHFVAMPL